MMKKLFMSLAIVALCVSCQTKKTQDYSFNQQVRRFTSSIPFEQMSKSRQGNNLSLTRESFGPQSDAELMKFLGHFLSDKGVGLFSHVIKDNTQISLPVSPSKSKAWDMRIKGDNSDCQFTFQNERLSKIKQFEFMYNPNLDQAEGDIQTIRRDPKAVEEKDNNNRCFDDLAREVAYFRSTLDATQQGDMNLSKNNAAKDLSEVQKIALRRVIRVFYFFFEAKFEEEKINSRYYKTERHQLVDISTEITWHGDLHDKGERSLVLKSDKARLKISFAADDKKKTSVFYEEF